MPLNYVKKKDQFIHILIYIPMKYIFKYLNRLACFSLLVFLIACSTHQGPQKQARLKGPAAEKSSATRQTAIIHPSQDIEDAVGSIAEPEESASEEIEALNKPGAWDDRGSSAADGAAVATGFELSGYDFPITINKQVSYYLDLFQGKQHELFARWLARSSRYVPAIEKELAKAGLPKDLAYLAMIESGFNPSAVSHAGAKGLWQFMPDTGRRYELSISSWVDERLHPEKSTQAAIQYLGRLYSQFDDWHLAVAAYNAGEGSISKAIKSRNTSDFWKIAASESLFQETKRYVPKLIAAIIIARNPEAYGFTDIEYQVPHSYEVVQVPASTNLAAVADTASIPVVKLKALNNELLKNVTPPSQKQYALRIPVGTKDLIVSNLHNLQSSPANMGYATHVVRKGETLTTISKRYKVSKTDLLKANNLRVAKLKQGQRLQIPGSAPTLIVADNRRNPQKKAETAPVAIHSSKSVASSSYTIKKGDTLKKVAQQQGVTVEQIKKWNKLKNDRSFQQGQKIVLYKEIGSPNKPTLASAAQKMQPVKMTASKQKKPADNSIAQLVPSGKKTAASTQSWYVVQQGDSVWTIAQRFNISVNNIVQWNRLQSHNLQIGNRLLVKKG